MKTFSAFLLGLCAANLACADEVAVMSIRFPKEKKPQQVVLELFPDAAPATVENFAKLARKKFYNGIAFHRIFPHTLVQAGDPLSEKEKNRGKVGTSGPGYTLAQEIRRKHVTGAVAMARLPDKINPTRRSNGSQFFVCLKPMPEYNGQYTVFGQVIGGMEVLERVSALPADSNDNPIDRVVIKSIRMTPREKVPFSAEKSKPKKAE